MEYMTDENDEYGWKYSKNLFLQVLEDKDGEATTSEITAEVGCSDMTTRRKMHDLEDNGLVESHKIGPALLWRLV